MSRVKAMTPSRIFAASTVNVPSALTLNAALIEQVVELNRLAAPVRFVDAEADRAKRRREKRRVHRPLETSCRAAPLSIEELQREESRHVGLGFFDGAVGVLQLLSHGRGCGRRR